MSGESQKPSSADDLQQVVVSGLQALPLSTLIGGPLDACIKAQAQSAQSTLDFIHQAGFTQESGQWKAVNLTFTYQKGSEKVQLTVPLLTVVPIPYIAIDKIDLEFQANISAVSSKVYEESDSAESDGSIQSGDTGGDAGSRRWVQPEFKANYSRKTNKTDQSESRYSSEYNLDIKVSASQSSMPAGLQSILNILQEGVSQAPAPPEVTVDPVLNILAKDDLRVPVTYVVTLTDSAGEPLNNQRIRFELERPVDATLLLLMKGVSTTGMSVSGTTDENGQLTLRVIMTEASYTEEQLLKLRITAGSQTFTDAELKLVLAAGSGSATPATLSFSPVSQELDAPSEGDSSSANIMLQVNDASDQGLGGVAVDFTLEDPIGDAVLAWEIAGVENDGSTGTGFTNDEGQIEVELTVAAPFYDSERVRVTASLPEGLSADATVELVGAPLPDYSLVVNPPSGSLSTDELNTPVSYTARLVDSEAQPVARQQVAFHLDPPEGATLELSAGGTPGEGLSASGATDENGEIVLDVVMTQASYTEPQTLALNVTTDLLVTNVVEAALQLTLPEVLPPVVAAITLDDREKTLQAPTDLQDPTSTEFSIQVTDSTGIGLANQTVNVTMQPPQKDAELELSLAGEVQPILAGSAMTDAQGNLQITITAENSFLQADSLSLTVSTEEGAFSDAATLDLLPALILDLAPSGTVVFDESDPDTLTQEFTATLSNLLLSPEAYEVVFQMEFSWNEGVPVQSPDPQVDWTMQVLNGTDTGEGTATSIRVNPDANGIAKISVAMTALRSSSRISGALVVSENDYLLSEEVGIMCDPAPAPPVAQNLVLSPADPQAFSGDDVGGRLSYIATLTDSEGTPMEGETIQVSLSSSDTDDVVMSVDAGTAVSPGTYSASGQTDESGQVSITVTQCANTSDESCSMNLTAQYAAGSLTDVVGITVSAPTPPIFSVAYGAIRVTSSYRLSIQTLACELTSGGNSQKVTARVDLNRSGQWEPFGDFNSVDSDISAVVGDAAVDSPATYDASIDEISMECQKWTQNGSSWNSPSSGRVSSTEDQSYVKLFMNGDTIPEDLSVGYNGQPALTEILADYLVGLVVAIPNNQVLFCFELGGSATGAAADYQDAVFLMTVMDSDPVRLEIQDPVPGEAVPDPSYWDITATLTDSQSNPVIGSSVDFSTNDADDIVALGSATDNTDSQGVCSTRLSVEHAPATSQTVVVSAQSADMTEVSDQVSIVVAAAPVDLPVIAYSSDHDGAFSVDRSYTADIQVLAEEIGSDWTVTTQFEVKSGNDDECLTPFGSYNDSTADLRPYINTTKNVGASFAGDYVFGINAQSFENGREKHGKTLKNAVVLLNGDDASSLASEYPPYGDQQSLAEIVEPYTDPATKQITLPTNQALVAFELTGGKDYQDLVLLITFNASEPANCSMTADQSFDSNSLPSDVHVTAEVQDTNGNPFIGQSVDFSKTYTTQLQVIQSSPSVVTDSQGAATVTITLNTADITTEESVHVQASYSGDDTVAAAIDLPVEPPAAATESMTYTFDNTQYNGDGAFMTNQSYQPEVLIIYSETGSNEVTARCVVGGENQDIFGDYEDPDNDIRLKNTDYLFPQTFAANTPFGICAQEWSGSTPKNPQTLSNAMILQDGDDATHIPSSGHNLKGHLSDYIVDNKITIESNQAIVAFEIGDGGNNSHTIPSSGDFADAVFLVTFHSLSPTLDFDADANNGDGGLVCNYDSDVNITLLAAENDEPVSCWYKMGSATYWLFDCQNTNREDYGDLAVPVTAVLRGCSAGENFGIYAKAWQNTTSTNECSLTSAKLLWNGDDTSGLPTSGHSDQQNLADILTGYGYVDSNGKISIDENQVIVTFELGVASADANSPAHIPPASGDYQDAVFLITFTQAA